MHTFHGYLSEGHKNCDQVLADLENAVSKSDWDKSIPLFKKFSKAMNDHLTMEEEILFPAMEERAGGPIGPTQIMRGEHIQMREVIGLMGSALETKNKNEFLGQSETLMMLIQQHNMKEEHVLYSMADDMIENETAELLAQMEKIAQKP